MVEKLMSAESHQNDRMVAAKSTRLPERLDSAWVSNIFTAQATFGVIGVNKTCTKGTGHATVHSLARFHRGRGGKYREEGQCACPED